MKITHLMLLVTGVVFAWLTIAYIRPVPASSYEHAKESFIAQEEAPVEDATVTLASTKD